MKERPYKVLITCLVLICSVHLMAQNPDPNNLLQIMQQKAKEIKTIRYSAIMNERIDGKMVLKNSSFKINVNPYKVYVSQSFIGISLDALFSTGWNNNQMLVATVGFPWLQLNLDPLGKRVRDNHHHTIYEAGFNYFVDVVTEIEKKHKQDIKISLGNNEIKNGKNCYKVIIDVNVFKTISYTVQKGENLSIIAKKHFINDYMILEKNPDIDYYDDVTSGQVINIPNVYAKQMVLYLDRELMLPVEIELFDDKGLYAVYSYNNLVINQPFAWDEFNSTYKGYHFR